MLFVGVCEGVDTCITLLYSHDCFIAGAHLGANQVSQHAHDTAARRFSGAVAQACHAIDHEVKAGG